MRLSAPIAESAFASGTGRYLLVPLLAFSLPFLAPAYGRAPTVVAPTEVVQVRHALDGDSIVLMDGRQVRLLGVNTPEIDPSSHRGGHDKPRAVTPQPLAREAQRFTAARVDGQTVTLHFETERTDRYQRLLAHVTLADGTRLEEALLRAGTGLDGGDSAERKRTGTAASGRGRGAHGAARRVGENRSTGRSLPNG